MNWWLEIPYSTFLILLISLSLSLISLGTMRRFVDIEMWRSFRREQSELFKLFHAYRKSKDEKILLKLRKKERKLQSIQRYVFKQQMKMYIINVLPFLLIFTFLIGFPLFGVKGMYPFDHPTAFLPFRFWLIDFLELGFIVDGKTALNALGWFILCSVLFSTILLRIAGYK